jgi:hypothetical protein
MKNPKLQGPSLASFRPQLARIERRVFLKG